jgi:hypothetical protein
MAKKTYRVRNWQDYNKSLVQRGSLTFWFSERIVNDWKASDKDSHGNQKHSNMMICSALTLRQLFNLPLRATAGLMKSLVDLMELSIQVADYSTLCRRGKRLKVNLGVKPSSQSRHVLVDSTGVQVMGEGEWKKLRHGECRQQLWRKLHIAMDADTQMILSARITESVRLDGNYLPELIKEIEGPISQVTGDGAYDKKGCYRAAYIREAKAVFPPQHNSIVQRNKIKKEAALLQRDNTIEFINNGDKVERCRLWKQVNNYHRRSLVEAMMSRMKSIFGDKMRSRSFENQKTDLLIRCYAINRINELGLPLSKAI